MPKYYLYNTANKSSESDDAKVLQNLDKQTNLYTPLDKHCMSAP